MDANKKLPLQLDWNQLLPSRADDEPPPMLIVKPPSDSLSHPRKPSRFGFDHPAFPADDLGRFNDRELSDMLKRKKATLDTTSRRLPDKGEKLRDVIKRYEDELARREMQHLDKEVDDSEKPRPDTSSSTVGVSNDLRKENRSSQSQPTSSFASIFNEKMENTNCQVTNAFSKELSLLKNCDNHKVRHNGDLSQKKRSRDQLSLGQTQLPFQCHNNISRRETLNDDKRCRDGSTFSPPNIGKRIVGCFPKLKGVFQAIQSDGARSRMAQPIVLDDEDGLSVLQETDQEDKLDECLKEAKIYYPSSDDPESVEICYMDIDCLSPGGYLTSTIMNFYIRYLRQQASLTNISITDYHFFNTYFYKKLKEAVSYKKSDRETFVKFRRWWKGVNIFQKAYVLIPIHEDQHWSLAIICIPDKEDESGPIILHLDSLGLHCSRSVFDNIRRYLIEEWKHLAQESMFSDISIAYGIWENLDSKIEDTSITVPQQKNDYDCGLFVLYFIKRFIEEAPKRLKMKDLAMFGKQWFKPEEASNLRAKIRNLLKEEFRNSCNQNSSN